MKKSKLYLLLQILLLTSISAQSFAKTPDESKKVKQRRYVSGDTLDIKSINNLVLKGEVEQVLKLLDSVDLYRKEDIEYKKMFEDRFKYTKDRTGFLEDIPPSLNSLYLTYQKYWRMCLLDKTKTNDSLFKDNLVAFFQKGEP